MAEITSETIPESSADEPAPEDEPAAEAGPSDAVIASQMEKAAEQERIGILDPDFILILMFAILVDIIDLIMLIPVVVTALAAYPIVEPLMIILDIFVFVVICWWMHWRLGRISAAKNKSLQTIKTKFADPKTMAAIEKKLGSTITKSPLWKSIKKNGLTWLGERIPLALPCWTLTVALTLREK